MGTLDGASDAPSGLARIVLGTSESIAGSVYGTIVVMSAKPAKRYQYISYWSCGRFHLKLEPKTPISGGASTGNNRKMSTTLSIVLL